MAGWCDPINRVIKIMLDLADLADEKQESPFDKELGLGYRALSGYLRQGVKAIIDLKTSRYNFIESYENSKENLKDNEDLLIDIFGTKDITDYQLTDEEKARIKAVVNEIIKEV